MSQLTSIRSRLAALRRRRQRWRWGMAWSALAITVLACLLGLFALDVGYEFQPARRIFLLAGALTIVVWGARKFSWSWWGVRESETEVALFVERQHGIDSDLVAALQFATPNGATWGSTPLRDAVVTRTVEATRDLDWNRGFDRQPLSRRLKWLGLLLLIAVGIAAAFPRHVAVFGVRLLLSERHYPTDTVIERIAVNSQTVLEWNIESVRPQTHRAPHGRPVEFLVAVTGELPKSGVVECWSREQRGMRQIDLTPVPPEQLGQLGAKVAPNVSYFRGDLPRLVEGFDYRIRIGDATTDRAALDMMLPPLAELTAKVTPPKYAISAKEATATPRQLLVLAGSRVDLRLKTLNAKRLQSAEIKITSGDKTTVHQLAARGPEGAEWSLPATTPLAQVTAELRYEVQVVDEDGLGLEAPLHGLVQLKSDRPPTAYAAVVHRVVLPTARPAVELRLNDDYGLAKAVLRVQLERQPGRLTEGTSSADEKFEFPIPLVPAPVIGQNLPFRSQFRLDLAQLKTSIGDQLKLTIAVTDFRGDLPGETTESDPLLLEVGDEAGVLAAISEADERSEKRLNDVIKQQLDVGRR